MSELLCFARSRPLAHRRPISSCWANWETWHGRGANMQLPFWAKDNIQQEGEISSGKKDREEAFEGIHDRNRWSLAKDNLRTCL